MGQVGVDVGSGAVTGSTVGGIRRQSGAPVHIGVVIGQYRSPAGAAASAGEARGRHAERDRRCGENRYARRMSGTLYLVAVPIGNPDDLSARARETLRAVAVVAAEDTRHFATLARHHGLAPRAVSYHDHNEADRTAELLGSSPGRRRRRARHRCRHAADQRSRLPARPRRDRRGDRRDQRAGRVRGHDGAGGFGPAAAPVPVHRLPAPNRRRASSGPGGRSRATPPRSSPSRLHVAWPMRCATRSPPSATGRHAWRGT